MWRAGQRLLRHVEAGQTPVIIHLGDHDPSGIDMTRDIVGRLEMFMGGTELKRVALNMDQVRKYNPPPNPAKITDSRCAEYIKNYGNESWELDALDPTTLIDVIDKTITEYKDPGPWEEAVAREKHGKQVLDGVTKHWSLFSKFIERRIAA
jgi:hypothetical protein